MSHLQYAPNQIGRLNATEKRYDTFSGAVGPAPDGTRVTPPGEALASQYCQVGLGVDALDLELIDPVEGPRITVHRSEFTCSSLPKDVATYREWETPSSEAIPICPTRKHRSWLLARKTRKVGRESSLSMFPLTPQPRLLISLEKDSITC
jgi:hypothetical protein